MRKAVDGSDPVSGPSRPSSSSAGCRSARAGTAETSPAVQPFSCERSYTRYARGYQHRGIYVDGGGEVFSDRRGRADHRVPRVPADSSTEQALLARCTPGRTRIARVSAAERAERYGQVLRAREGALSQRVRRGADMGAVVRRCYLPDAGGVYREVLLRRSGDRERENLSPPAAQLSRWPGSIAPRAPRQVESGSPAHPPRAPAFARAIPLRYRSCALHRPWFPPSVTTRPVHPFQSASSAAFTAACARFYLEAGQERLCRTGIAIALGDFAACTAGEGTATFCKRCAYLWEMKGLRLCPERGDAGCELAVERCRGCEGAIRSVRGAECGVRRDSDRYPACFERGAKPYLAPTDD